MTEVHHIKPMITNDAVILGILLIILAIIFKTANSDHPVLKKFYTYVPSLLLCYFVPSLLNTFGLVSGETSGLYFVASRYLLPASLVLLTISIDLQSILRLGPKAIVMFLVGTFGIIIGGPLSILIVSAFAPQIVGGAGPNAVWRGLATIAGSWIGGAANQTAMKEVFGASNVLFSAMITVDVIVANIWMGILLFGAGRTDAIDRIFKGDTTAIESLKTKIREFRSKIARIPTLSDMVTIAAVGFGATAFAHIVADTVAPWMQTYYPQMAKFSLTSPFFWIIVTATTAGLILSFTPARKLEGVGASRMGSLFLYVLVATIGMKMNILAIFDYPGLFLVGIIWMIIHITILLSVAKMIKAPFFFVAVGSQANIGGAASAPIVASAFDTALAPVGVLLAVLGYSLGTYGAWICAILMELASKV
jgi:uncharacterized membrane protein